MAMSPQAIQTMANHAAFLCLVAELGERNLINIANLAARIDDVGAKHEAEEPAYGGLIREIGRNVKEMAKNQPNPPA
ncbi:hypothetical protein GJU94_14025 [Brucella sp. 10RB9214]|uniref:hypothetical protein n=1 Tax=unclassified Brucella TaxID=2632610 RepID=UPI0012AE72B8|nr:MULTISPECIES: hypothetical protein [unclassified Brucella]MRN45473.1 hypothetical protein [Brucella sp. 10RB9212]MRN50931.1 hypothetical protein [Brucella sp. 10RB9214]